MNTVAWVLLVTLFDGQTTQIVETARFDSFAECVEQSQQRVRDHHKSRPDTSVEITASCSPVDQ
jgi:hypothetical protein